MIININPDWRIESDPLQWIVQKRRIVKGLDRWESLSFHRSLENAALRFAQKRIWSMDGKYGPDALPILCQALTSLESEIIAAISTAGLGTIPKRGSGGG